MLPIFAPTTVPNLAIKYLVSGVKSFGPLSVLFNALTALYTTFLACLLGSIGVGSIPFLTLLVPIVVGTVMVNFRVTVFVLPSGAFV